MLTRQGWLRSGGALVIGWGLVSAARADSVRQTWQVRSGTAVVTIGSHQSMLNVDSSSLELVSWDAVFRAFTTGEAALGGAPLAGGAYVLSVRRTELELRNGGTVYSVSAGDVLFDAVDGTFAIGDAQLLHASGDNGDVETVGSISAWMKLALLDTQIVPDDSGPPSEQDQPEICNPANPGPDVIVGDLGSVANYGQVGTIRAYAVATTSCNLGTQNVGWHSNTNQHPVIAQNLYRLKTVNGAGRFEQIGMSWLKHGFFALSDNLCCPCNGTDGSTLGTGCSDTYDAGLNGQQSNLGPRSQVNANTGFFPYPFSAPAAPPTIGRRLQVEVADLDPAQNSGALYFTEGHYIAPDDATYGAGTNDNNNASYRQVTVGASPYNIFNATGSMTQRQSAAILAWKAQDSGVATVNIDVPSEGRFTLAYKVTDLGGGEFHYEYALYNMNSDRSGQSFTVPIPEGVTVSNVDFHAVFSHSGEPYSNAAWTSGAVDGSFTWATQTYAQNVNANALRWGTLYNFRFDANTGPQNTSATLGLFKPVVGQPDSVTVATKGPSPVPVVLVDISSANPPTAAANPYAPGQPFRDVLDTGTDNSLTAGIGAGGTSDQGAITYSPIHVTFSGAPPLPPTVANVAVACTGLPCPTVSSITAGAGTNEYLVTLGGAIPPGQCTTITFPGIANIGQKLQYQSLPFDTNLDGSVNTSDLLQTVQRLNDGTANLSANLALYNTDRAGGVNTSDLLRGVQLLNGVNTTQAWNGAGVAACP
jgi:hypothetical protein